jgi:S1-C subfamily serine protease
LVVLAVMALVVGVVGAYLLTGGMTDSNSALSPGIGATQPAPAPTTQSTPPTSSPATAIDEDALAAKVDPAVVDINTTLGLQNARAAGTGVVLTSTGLVLTNNHVIAGETQLRAFDVGNGRTYDGTVVGYSQSEDIAVVQLNGASGLATATLGDSDAVTVGQPVLALGNAGGAGGTPSAVTGTVTAVDRAITATDDSGGSERLTGLIEIAADIKPGDSGGPLVDANGRVIGIDTAATSGFRYQVTGGRGYAIPIKQAMSIANEITAGRGSATIHIGPTAFLGVLTTSSTNGPAGAGVVGVVPDSPADSVGIETGDIIVSMDGSTVDSPTTIGQLMVPHHPNDSARIGWLDRLGRGHEATVTLATGPPA